MMMMTDDGIWYFFLAMIKTINKWLGEGSKKTCRRNTDSINAVVVSIEAIKMALENAFTHRRWCPVSSGSNVESCGSLWLVAVERCLVRSWRYCGIRGWAGRKWW